MSHIMDLYNKALNSPNNLSFKELCSLVEAVGFVFKRGKGSHKIYKNEKIKGLEALVNIQNFKGKAKPYQVKQVIGLIERFGLLPGGQDV